MNIIESSYSSSLLLRKANFKLVCILLLNIADGLLTYYGVSKAYAVEVNLLMLPVVSNVRSLLFYKILLPTVLIALVVFIINKYDYSRMFFARLFINICFGIYIAVLLLHFVWIGMLVYSKLF